MDDEQSGDEVVQTTRHTATSFFNTAPPSWSRPRTAERTAPKPDAGEVAAPELCSGPSPSVPVPREAPRTLTRCERKLLGVASRAKGKKIAKEAKVSDTVATGLSAASSRVGLREQAPCSTRRSTRSLQKPSSAPLSFGSCAPLPREFEQQLPKACSFVYSRNLRSNHSSAVGFLSPSAAALSTHASWMHFPPGGRGERSKHAEITKPAVDSGKEHSNPVEPAVLAAQARGRRGDVVGSTCQEHVPTPLGETSSADTVSNLPPAVASCARNPPCDHGDGSRRKGPKYVVRPGASRPTERKQEAQHDVMILEFRTQPRPVAASWPAKLQGARSAAKAPHRFRPNGREWAMQREAMCVLTRR